MTPAMQVQVERVVERIAARGYGLIVGDAPGVDTAAVQLAQQCGIGYMCYGIKPRPRNGAMNYTRLPTFTYRNRDRLMVDMADLVYCIWDGNSSGTKAVCDYARETDTEAYLWREG